MKPYIPSELPISDLNFNEIIKVVGKTSSSLARYDGILMSILNPTILLSPLTNQEAVLSSKIEGTQATLREVLKHESGEEYDKNKNDDIQEILNYRRALVSAEEHINERPLNNSLLLSVHKILMESVRGQDKTPGKFRKTQNWFGPKGCPIEEATFVPPSPLQLNDYLNQFETYIKYDDVDCLVQTAILHAQFELLHPFLDGNGRIGRLLIPLFLYYKKAISAPMFYISGYLEKNRDQYYHRLQMISQKSQWTEWVLFFLGAVNSQAKANTKKGLKIIDLYELTKRNIQSATHSQFALPVLDFIFNKPIFTIPELVDYAQLNRITANKIVNKLHQSSVIQVLRESSGRTPAIFIFSELISIVESEDFE